MKVKRAVWAWLAAALAVFAIVMAGANVALADTGDTPAHSKSSTSNGDGTHKIELTVTGDADDEKENDSHVNVLIVYDESSSMTNDNPSRADYAEDAMYTFVNGLIGYQNQGVDIAMAEVGFGTGSDTRSGWTTTLTTIRGHFNQGVNGQINRGAHGNYGYNGTNWASAFNRAEGLLDNLGSRSSYPTFVVLVTDGGPTAGGSGGTTVPGPNVPWTSYRSHYLAATGDANAIQNRENVTLYGIYAFGTDANLLDDLMYYANTGSHRQKNGYSIQNATQQQADFSVDDGADHYYTAEDADALNAAISEIFNQIVEVMGITEVSMSDGTTSEVKASSGEVTSLLGIDEDSYQYWMSIPVDANNQFKRTKNVNGSAEEITYTVGSDGTVTWTEGGESKSVTLDGSVKNGQFKFEWTSDSFPNDLYEYAPPAAQLVDGAVEWDLSSVGVLLDGVTYSVTFDVYPSQTALDYKARLDNGEAYTDVVPEHAREYFHDDGTLETNTEATLTFSDSRDGTGPTTTGFENPPAISTEAESMTVEKKWEGGDPPKEGLDVEVLMDDETDPFEIVALSSGNNWSADIHISYGIIRHGKVMPDAPGHDFSFAELGDEQYRWELVAPTVHPMIIDGEKTMLIKVDENFPLGDHEPIEIDGEQYYIDAAITSLSAINYRRSNLNLTKVVTGEGADPDATFPFTLKVDNAKAPEDEPTDDPDHNSDYWVWFSIKDAEGNYVTTDANVQNATQSGNYFYAKSGDEITLDMRADWNLRFTNLPSGSTYVFTEGDATCFKFTKAESTGAEDETFVADGKKATGTIVTYNDQAYEVTYTNEYAAVDITAKKVWDDGGNKGGSRPDELTLTLNGLPEGTTAPEPTVTKDGDTWTYTWKGVPKYDDSGEVIEYTVSEDNIPDNYSCETTTVDPDGTITNTYSAEGEAEVTVTKALEGADWPEGKTLTLTLKGSGNAPMPETTTVTLTAAGDATFGPIAFDLGDAGKTYTYTVSEDGFGTGWTSSGDVKVTIKVTDNGDGTLKTDVSYSPSATITNTYKPKPVRIDPPIKKVVTGDTPPTDETFTFQMRALTEGAPMPSGSSDGVKTKDVKGAGEYEFGWISYTEPGTYEYEVSEVAGSNPNYTYDSNKYTITVEVTDEGGQLVATVTGGENEAGLTTFTNEYTKPSVRPKPKPPVVPKTGDETPQVGLIALLGAALLGYGVYRRRKA